MKKQKRTPRDLAIHPCALPWNRPVPVRKSEFVSMFREGSIYNVETDLGQIEAYSCTRKRFREDQLLYSDQQISPVFASSNHMGSGRSGYYKGRYLKGVGRTLLAGNWNSEELLHSSGHLMMSGAIREYLVTCLLKAKGIGHAIVQCDGLLARPIARSLKGNPDLSYKLKPKNGLVPEIDYHLQAISYKEGNFARASNLIWYLYGIGSRIGVRSQFTVPEFFHLLLRHLDPNGTSSEALCRSPVEIVDQIEQAMLRCARNFQGFYLAGVHWGSLDNNFSLDGRFLDLEIPLFLGGPLVGGTSKIRKTVVDFNDLRSVFSGTEVFRVLHDWGVFCRVMLSMLEFRMKHRLLASQEESEFLHEFCKDLRRRFDDRHWIFSKRKKIKWVEAMIREALGFEGRDLKSLRRILDKQYFHEDRSSIKPIKRGVARFQSSGVRLALPEPVEGLNPNLLVLGQMSRRAMEEAEFVNSKIFELGKIKNCDEALVEVLDLGKKIEKFIEPAPQLSCVGIDK